MWWMWMWMWRFLFAVIFFFLFLLVVVVVWVVGFVVTIGSVVLVVLRIVGLRKRETGRERKNNKETIFK